ncbi:hypothetical protein ESCO_001972 [Escovopsis weberi]|uniref:Uncharacterized protein n=1 Tax=Escovopsis weberi TaxID=150374 RepID=A0A0M9VWZ1_ESCWE|nr:hypothetical protein ESCO_001972 [Escovopsis weberi]
MSAQAQVIMAPSRPPRPPPPAAEGTARPSIFLAGTTSPTEEPDWREKLTSDLAHLPITIFNPRRADWGASWREDMSDSRFREQVEWELEMQDRADVVVVFLHGVSAAPISLLELGLCVRSGRAVVCALDSYSKRGNVEAVCRRYGAVFVSSMQELRDAVMARLGAGEERR